jgi:SAM-dependent methyltransferase
MANESVKDFYNRLYRSHHEQRTACPNSLHDLAKAQRRVSGAIRGFGIQNCGPGGRILDVGSGLGYYTKALSLTGASVTGIDFSEAAIEAAKATFSDCQFSHGAWPDDVPEDPKFDLIWTINFSFINTFDVDLIRERLVSQAMLRLKPDGCLVIGWNTNFSGRAVGNWSFWPLEMLRNMRQTCGLSAPLVIESRTSALNWFMIRAALVLRRSIPIFMVRRKSSVLCRLSYVLCHLSSVLCDLQSVLGEAACC